jgi:YbgC/YbaW family acyl-CoA thioester hydrolase
MPYEFKITRLVDFAETDMAGIVHYANFFHYMEAAEHRFFRSMGFSIWTQQVDPPVGWPRVHVECDYKQPLRFEDEIEIHLLVAEKKAKSLTYQFRIRKLNASPPVEVARGKVTTVCVTHQHGKLSAAVIPKLIADKIEVAPAELLQ